MNWEAIGAVGEVLGAAAVVATLGYLAVQIRQNSRAVKNSAAQSLLSEANESLRVASSHPTTARAVILGQTLFDELSEGEKAQFITWIFAWMRTIEQAYLQYVQGYIDEEIWEGHKAHHMQLVHAPAVKEWWSHRSHFFSKTFQNYMNELAALKADAPTPTDVIKEMSEKRDESSP
jgi:hypothetical protein